MGLSCPALSGHPSNSVEIETFWVGAAPHRVRVMRCAPEGASRGTLFLFPGRSSILSIRMPVVHLLCQAGWTVYTWDWRGQGESERWLRNPHLIDLGSFDDYIADVNLILASAQAADAPTPFVGLGLSLGGHVLLRTLEEGAPLEAAILCVPLVEVHTAPWSSRSARLLAKIATWCGGGGYAVPHQPRIDLREVVQRMEPSPEAAKARLFLEEHPETLTDTVTLRWVDAMFSSVEKMSAPPALAGVEVPVMIVVADQDQICNSQACFRLAAGLPDAEVLTVKGDHFFFTQPMEELAELRGQVERLFDQVAPVAHRP